MRKILFIVESMGGGVFTFITELANALVKFDDVYIAHGIRPDTPSNYREYFDFRVHLIRVQHFTSRICFQKDIQTVWEIRKIAHQICPDIIHLHSSKAGAVGRIAFKNKNVPLFYTPHGYSFLMENYSSLKRNAFKMIEFLCAQYSRAVTVSCSESEHQETLKLTRRAICISNGVNTDEIDHLTGSAESVPEHPFTVFTSGRICCQKNPALFNRIAEILPDTPFIWIGDGELRNELKAPNITVTGWMKRKELLERIQCADVFILTSLWEGLSFSLLESMYMKKLCIVSNIAGNQNVIHNGKNGYLCNTAEEFAERIRNAAISFPAVLADHARQDILDAYNVKLMKNRYMELYHQVGRGQKIGKLYC